MTNNLTRTTYLESLTWTPPTNVVPSWASIVLHKKCVKSQQEIKTLNHTHLPSVQSTEIRRTEVGMGTLEEHNYVCPPTIQPSTINH